ncbi:MAG: ribbon-helix-helix domain-containing protein [Magnetospirillum gryphiswaldense]|nr:ribbon-helix-helix domain-containing protein [Magnetospirillum gryphiswaldense]
MLRKHSIIISGHASSVSLEPEFWDEFRQIADRLGLSVNQLVSRIDSERGGNLSSAVRVFVLNDLRDRIKTT